MQCDVTLLRYPPPCKTLTTPLLYTTYTTCAELRSESMSIRAARCSRPFINASPRWESGQVSPASGDISCVPLILYNTLRFVTVPPRSSMILSNQLRILRSWCRGKWQVRDGDAGGVCDNKRLESLPSVGEPADQPNMERCHQLRTFWASSQFDA